MEQDDEMEEMSPSISRYVSIDLTLYHCDNLYLSAIYGIEYMLM